MHGSDEKGIQNFTPENVKRIAHMEDVDTGLGGKIILKWDVSV
jgi:hypothetical protein